MDDQPSAGATQSGIDTAVLLDASLRLLEPTPLQEFPAHVLNVLRSVVACDAAAYTEIDPVHERHVSQLLPEVHYTPEQFEAFASHALENPLIAYYFEEGDTYAHRVSDFLGLAEWQETRLWQEVYRPFGYNHQLAITLPARLPLVVGIAFHRSSNDFSEQDCHHLNLLRSHVVAAHRNAMLFTTLGAGRHALAEFVRREHSSIGLVHHDGRLEAIDPHLESVLARYDSSGERIDASVIHQLMSEAQEAVFGDPLLQTSIIHHRFGPNEHGHELVLSLSPGSDRSAGLLVVEEQPVASVADPTGVWGLSQRESEVADALARAMSNAEIASHLKISVGTVRKHLQRVFAKLDVDSRTAAALLVQESYRSRPK